MKTVSRNNILRGLAVTAASVLTLAGCAAAPSAEPSETETPVDYKACMVSDFGGFDDASFNEANYNGLQQAVAELGVDSAEAESKAETDYEPNVLAMVDEGCDMIVNVGFALAAATDTASAANPGVNFVLVDSTLSNADFSPKYVDNVKPLLFDTAEAAFLAGYLAAATSKTGKVATFGGLPFPSVTIFMDGFKQGVAHHNETKGTNVEVLGAAGDDPQSWTMAGTFDDINVGKQVSLDFIAQGADVILPVAGPVGIGSGQAALENEGVYIIGVDADWYGNPTHDEYKDLILTTILKDMQLAVFETIKSGVDGAFSGGDDVYVGNLANGGVGISEDKAGIWPAGLADEIAALQAEIVAGTINVVSSFD